MAPRKDILRLVIARFISRAGSEAAFFIGVWGKAAYVLDATAYELAILMFCLSIASILGSAVAGVLIDRYGPRKVLVFAEAGFVVAAMAMIFADTLPLLVLVASTWGFLGAPVGTSAASFAPHLVTEESQLAKVNSWIEGGASLAFAVGPALGALLARFAHVNWIFVLDAITSLVAALLVWRISTQPPVREDLHKTHALTEMREGLKAAYGLRPIRYYLLMGSLVWLAFGAFGALEPLFFRDAVGTGIETIGWMNSLFGIGFITGAWLLPRLPKQILSAKGLASLGTLVGLGAILYVAWTDLRIIAVGAFVWALIVGILEPLLRTLMHRDSPRALVGRIIGTSEVHRRAGELLPLAVAPALAGAIGVQQTLIGFAVLASIIAAGSFGEARAIDREARLRGAVPVPETIRMAEEPISPNP
ncbi:MAG: MFS transporter [Coriobacteriia bacterium]|nr:MFS transporter [Coriobacteriia bacterium]MBN2823581.1 MFS transporter [Coriobacteriia bacterium]